MSKTYNHTAVEKKWQKDWEKKQPNKASDTSTAPKFYALIEFPFLSGEGLHVGHIRSNTAMDIISRKRRAEGYNVLYPIGWDAFGLPTENYAIKTGLQPAVITKNNIKAFTRQLKALGFSFDWSTEISTSDPKYYKWTQWIFLQFLKKGLAYKKKMAINWCPKDKIGLANEEVVDGKCERCGTPVEKKEKEQWMLAITKYADRLDKDLDDVDYLERIKIQQRNWIGRSESTEIDFALSVKGKKLKIVTTRPDTIFGATFIVIAPDHSLIEEEKKHISNYEELVKYARESLGKEEFERGTLAREKSGLLVRGVEAIHPFTKQEIPIYSADYVLSTYGTGAIMAVPAHDERDYEFAKKFGIPMVVVIDKPKELSEYCFNLYDEDNSELALELRSLGRKGEYLTPTIATYVVKADENKKVIEILQKHKVGSENNLTKISLGEYFTLEPQNILLFTQVYSEDGVHINSDFLNGLNNKEGIKKANAVMTQKGIGKETIHFHLRDWVFSRQRYWGEPIPVIHCEKCGVVPVPEKDLPVTLPKVKNYQPTDTGESPLASISSWVNVKCPQCKGKAKRETDTMPNWAGSSWYFLRYLDPKNKKAFADPKKIEKWMPVDWYNGGMEHTTLHLLYSRFWHKFLFDLGLVSTHEPYQKRTSHGLILAQGGEKMSKSKGNVVNPDDVIKLYGADTLRVYEMFMGPFDQPIAWSTDNMIGSRRFVERVWRLAEKVDPKGKPANKDLTSLVHKTIKKVGDDIETMSFNTAISSLMILVNAFEKETMIAKQEYETLLRLVAPFAPHITEELWAMLKNKKSIHAEAWPSFDQSKLISAAITITVQVNGKMRDTLEISPEDSQEEIKNKAMSLENVKKWLDGNGIKRVIYVKNRLINLVI